VTLLARDVTVRHPRSAQPAVRDVTLTLAPGELVVVAGPNGSGKSTLFAALLGGLAVEAGAVTLDGRPVSSWPRAEFARQVGALPQREDTAFPLRVRDAVMLGRWARLGPVAPVTAADHRAVESAMARTRLTALAERPTDTLSGGEWQRVRLARSLAAEPRYLLLDEPGAALDLAHEMALFELLSGLVATGMGVLAITHHLNLATRYADRVALLDRGTMAGEGAPAEVLTAARVSQVFGWPVAVERLADGSPHLVPLRLDEAPPRESSQ
jgi:iron complex transport system ATP-binding protein